MIDLGSGIKNQEDNIDGIVDEAVTELKVWRKKLLMELFI